MDKTEFSAPQPVNGRSTHTQQALKDGGAPEFADAYLFSEQDHSAVKESVHSALGYMVETDEDGRHIKYGKDGENLSITTDGP